MSPLREGHLAEFEERGYFVTEVLFDAALLEAVRGEIERVWTGSVARLEGHAFGRIRPQLQHLHAESTLLGEFCRQPVFADIALALLGPDGDLVFNQAFIKAGGGHRLAEVPWHQDAAFAELTELGYNCFVAITPATAQNGALRVARGRPLQPHQWDDELAFPRCDLASDAGELIELLPGQVLVFDQQVVHRSSSNTTSCPRIAYSLGYSSPNARLERGNTVFGERVPLVRSGRHVDTLLRDYAQARCGAEDTQLARAVLSELADRGVPATALFAGYRRALRGDGDARDMLRRLVTPHISWDAEVDQGNVVNKSPRTR
jgi:hypothetical protein